MAHQDTTPDVQGPSYMNAGPLYAFSLPQELLQVIQLRSPFGTASDVAPENEATDLDAEDPDNKAAARSDGSALRCSLCGIARFESISDQRAHFSSDWHRYNIKRSLSDKPAVKEEEWDSLLEGLSDSISGTASSSEDESDDNEAGDGNTVSRLLAKQKLSADPSNDSDEVEEPSRPMSVNSPLLWFEAPQEVKDTQFGIYKTIFPTATKNSTPTSWTAELQNLQVSEDSSRLGKRAAARIDGVSTDPSSRKWTLLAVGGGHFAGAVVSLVPQLNNRNGRIERELVLLASKTFHRYTTRRKQGGAQSANDQAKSKAKSAGAQIRRYNEAMLTQEIRELLTSWKEHVETSELIFLRAGKTSQRIFYDYDDAVLLRKDVRMRTFPFPTRRPTQAELIRCFSELTKVKITHLTKEELDELEAAYRAALQPKKVAVAVAPQSAPAKPEVPKLSKEELLLRDRWERVLDMVKKDRVEAFQNFVEKQSSDTQDGDSWTGPLPSWIAEHRSLPTLLHFAANYDSPNVVRYLLAERRVDPTLCSVGENVEEDSHMPVTRTAYECAASRSVRDVFRKVYAEHPDWWRWEEDAKVPSMLTEEMANAQGAKKAERKNKLKDKLRERAAEREQERALEEARRKQEELETARLAEEKRRSTPVSGPQRLGGGPPGMRPPVSALGGLSEEAKRRIERERRLRAAEARAQLG